MIHLNNLLKSYVCYMISAFGISLTIKANIGVSSFSAMNMALSSVASIKIGTITTFINVAFLLFYMYLTKFELKQKYVIQTISILMFGAFINFFTYVVLNDMSVSGYGYRLMLVALGTIIGGIAVGMIVNYDTITFPLEGVCVLIAQRTKYTFTLLRYAVDVFSVIISLSLSFIYDLPLFVREGTIISLLLFSFVIGIVQKRFIKRTLHPTAVES